MGGKDVIYSIDIENWLLVLDELVEFYKIIGWSSSLQENYPLF